MKLPFRVLVLEDDEHALSGIVELLRDAGHNVTGAATYDAAKRLLAVSPFDLLVSDVRLRSFNGLHLVMQTRTDHPEIGVIIITGYDDPLIDMEAHRYHAQLVRKPIRPAEFLRTVNLPHYCPLLAERLAAIDADGLYLDIGRAWQQYRAAHAAAPSAQ